MQYDDIKHLLKKYHNGEATEEEIALLESWYLQYNEQGRQSPGADELLQDANEVWHRLHAPQRRPIMRNLWAWSVAAAACLLLGVYLFVNHDAAIAPIKPIAAAPSKPDTIVPGSNKAILTLANGKKIILTNDAEQRLNAQGNVSITKTANGQLTYIIKAGKPVAGNKLVYNTVSTPMGGQYWVVLADGTRVFLNAGSSLRFPVAFSAGERKVTLTGEAYFEVVHNDASPFRIVTAGQVIEDIGTSFNVNAYDDEPVIKTTLVEGAVKISTHAHQAYLKPGQQSVVSTINPGQDIRVLNHVNMNEALAWKNGLFEFDRADLRQVMNAASRWYDFKVTYQHQKIPPLKISGRMSRNVNFSGFIALLEFEGVKFDVKGRSVTIKN